MDSLGNEGDENFVNRISTINTASVGVGEPDATVTIRDSDGTLLSYLGMTLRYVAIIYFVGQIFANLVTII